MEEGSRSKIKEFRDVIHPSLGVPGMVDGTGVVFNEEVFSLSRTGPTMAFTDVLVFFGDGAVPTYDALEVYTRRRPFEKWGRHGPCSPSCPTDPFFWHDGARMSLSRVYAYSAAQEVEEHIRFIKDFDLPHLLPGIPLDYECSGDFAGPGQQRDGMIQCATTYGVHARVRDWCQKDETVTDEMPLLLRAVMPLPMLLSEILGIDHVLAHWRKGDLAVRTLHAVLSKDEDAARWWQQAEELGQSCESDFDSGEDWEEKRDLCRFAAIHYCRTLVELEKALGTSAPPRTDKAVERVHKIREVASAAAMNAAILLFYAFAAVDGVTGVADVRQETHASRGVQDLRQAFFFAAMAVSYWPTMQTLQMLMFVSWHVAVDTTVFDDGVDKIRVRKLNARLGKLVAQFSRKPKGPREFDRKLGGRVFYGLSRLLPAAKAPPLRHDIHLAVAGTATAHGLPDTRGGVVRLLALGTQCDHGAAALDFLAIGVIVLADEASQGGNCVCVQGAGSTGRPVELRDCSTRATIQHPISCGKALQKCAAKAFARIAGPCWPYIRVLVAIGSFVDPAAGPDDVKNAVDELRVLVSYEELVQGTAHLSSQTGGRLRLAGIVRRLELPVTQHTNGNPPELYTFWTDAGSFRTPESS